MCIGCGNVIVHHGYSHLCIPWCTAVLSIKFGSEKNEWLPSITVLPNLSNGPLESLAWVRTRSIVQCVVGVGTIGKQGLYWLTGSI